MQVWCVCGISFGNGGDSFKKFLTNWCLRYPNSFCCLKNGSVITSNCIHGFFWKSDQYLVSIVYVNLWFNSDEICLFIKRKIAIFVVWFYVSYISFCFCKTYTMMWTSCSCKKYHVCVWNKAFISFGKHFGLNYLIIELVEYY